MRFPMDSTDYLR